VVSSGVTVGKVGTISSADVAYITTSYPSPSHTFVQREIQGLEALGIAVMPVSVNVTPDKDLLTDLDRWDAARTFFIKQASILHAAKVAARFTLASPKAVFHTMRIIVGLGVTDLRQLLWHLFQMVEAMLVVEECERRGVTHIHAHFGEVPATVAWFAAELGQKRKGRSVRTWSVTVHGWREFTNEAAASLPQKLRNATFVAGISDFTRSQLMRLAGATHADHRFNVVRCGLPLDDYPFEPRHDLAAEPVILMTARLSEEKGHLILLDALTQLRETGIVMHAVFIGGGPMEALLAKETTRLGLDNQVTWMGAQAPSVVHTKLQECDIFCLPSFAEGLPVSLMEAGGEQRDRDDVAGWSSRPLSRGAGPVGDRFRASGTHHQGGSPPR
jgi:colanic acid/amylovoran biosynthesis glycosyltransferase